MSFNVYKVTIPSEVVPTLSQTYQELNGKKFYFMEAFKIDEKVFPQYKGQFAMVPNKVKHYHSRYPNDGPAWIPSSYLTLQEV